MSKKNFINLVDNDLFDCDYINKLPLDLYGFKKKHIKRVLDNEYDFLHYEHSLLCKKIIFYYDYDTREYKLRVRHVMVDVCRYEFFSKNIHEYEINIKKYFDLLLLELVREINKPLDNLYKEKIFYSDERIKDLPKKLNGYKLFITPNNPQYITNGSYLLINYVDFSIRSGIGIFYNTYMDVFYSELFLLDKPVVIYDFDTSDIHKLNEIIDDKLDFFLKNIRQEVELLEINKI